MNTEELEKQILNQLNTNIDKDVNELSQIVGNKDYLKNLEMLKSINHFKDESSPQMKELLKLNGNLLFDNFKNLTNNYLEKFETYNEYVNLESKNSKYINVEKLIEFKNLIKENYELNKYVFDKNPNIDKKDFENTVNDIKNINKLFNKIIIVQLSDLNIKDDVLSKLDENTKLDLCKSPNMTDNICKIFIKEDNDYLNMSIARYTKSKEILDILSNDEYEYTLINVGNNKNTSKETLEEIYYRTGLVSIKEAIAENENLSEKMFEILSKSDFSKVREALASNESTPLKVLETLSKDVERDVKYNVIRNPNCTEKIEKELFKEDSLKSSIACKTTSQEILTLATKDEDIYTRVAVLYNPNSSKEVLNKLSLDSNESISKQAIEKLASLENKQDDDYDVFSTKDKKQSNQSSIEDELSSTNKNHNKR